MLINKKILGLIGFAARARKISYGTDSVKLQLAKGKVRLLIISEEASDRTKKDFINLSEEYNIPKIIGGSNEELSKAIGKSNKAVIGIHDKELSNEIRKINDGGEIIG